MKEMNEPTAWVYVAPVLFFVHAGASFTVVFDQSDVVQEFSAVWDDGAPSTNASWLDRYAEGRVRLLHEAGKTSGRSTISTGTGEHWQVIIMMVKVWSGS